MCQQDIIKYMINQRLSGNHDYFSIPELIKTLSLSPKNVYDKMYKLFQVGFLEVSVPKGKSKYYYKRKYRVKKIYLELGDAGDGI